MRKTLAIKMLLAFLTITGCKTYKSSDDEIVNIDGKVVFSQDKSPLGQTVITRVSDGKHSLLIHWVIFMSRCRPATL